MPRVIPSSAIRRTAILFGAIMVIALPLFAVAQGPLVPCGTSATPYTPCSICHFAALAINITKFLMYYVALPATALLVGIGGIMLLIAGPSEPLRNRGKEILKATVIGVIIVFLGWILVDTVIKVVTDRWSGGAGNLLIQLGPWNEFDVAACSAKL